MKKRTIIILFVILLLFCLIILYVFNPISRVLYSDDVINYGYLLDDRQSSSQEDKFQTSGEQESGDTQIKTPEIYYSSNQLESGVDIRFENSEKITFETKEELHSMTVYLISKEPPLIRVVITSSPQEQILQLGGVWNVDTDENSLNDLSVDFKGIQNNEVLLNLKSLEERTQKGYEKGFKMYAYIFISIFIFIVILIIIIFLINRNR